MAGFTRPENAWRYSFGGLNTKERADALGPTKNTIALNIRRTADFEVRGRPGYEELFSTGVASRITDVRAYSALETDNNPRFLARNALNNVYLDTGVLAAVLLGSSQGCCMIPYRPNQSPQSWMYIASDEDYQKVSAPDSADAVTQYRVGIKEQQAAPGACPNPYNYDNFSGLAADWTQGGTGTAPFDFTDSDTAGDVFEDPESGSLPRYSVEVTASGIYQIGQVVTFDAAGSNLEAVVQDVLPPVNDGGSFVIDSIFYYSGVTGRCVIVPQQMPALAEPEIVDNTPTVPSVFTPTSIAALRRGSLIELNSSEKCFVLSSTTGPGGQVCFEVETAATFVAGDTIVGLPAISVSGITTAEANKTIDSNYILYGVTVGTGTLDQILVTNPFIQALAPSSNTPQDSDYLNFSIRIDLLARLTSGQIAFDVGTGVVDFSTNAYVYDFDAADLMDRPAVAPFPYQYADIRIPISGLTRLGTDLTRTLVNARAVRMSLVATNTISVSLRSLWVGGGEQADVGEDGSPYFYAVRGRSSATGAVSNPSPITRYGVSPRRQSVNITAVDDAGGDPQMDIWDIFRYGGSITSFRRIGSMPNTGSTDEFTDNYSDTDAAAGLELEYDNFEPWPTIDVPYTAEVGAVSNVFTVIEVVGTSALVTYYSSSAFTDPAPSTILRWLPGTLVLVGGQSAYTLRNRPTAKTLVSPPDTFYYSYLLEFVESAGTASPDSLYVNEPNVANQTLPYLFGPNSAGDVFACGDELRPGNVYYCKSFNPDSAPDSYNREITNPSEPLIGGDVINGIALVGSPIRWFALYPNFSSTTQRYQVVQIPVGRGLAAPNGHCTDGKRIFFWAKDGIWFTAGGVGQSLTDADLYNLFPHEGVIGRDYEYGTYTVYAPDYKYASQFRLAFCNSYLYADYLDSNGFARTLTCDLRDPDNPVWCVDESDLSSITSHYAVEQQAGTLRSNSESYPYLIMGDLAGNVHSEKDLNNDDTEPVRCAIGTFEFNGGDSRSDSFWNDVFLDCIPQAAITAGPVSDGAQAVTPTVVAAATVRTAVIMPVALSLRYLGLLCQWSDDYDAQDEPTLLILWQPMYQGTPIVVRRWATQWTSFGLIGYMYIRQISFAYTADEEVTLTISAYDGTAPSVITLPATAGVVKKVLFPVSFNKGQLYKFDGESDGDWQPYLSDCEFYVGQWGRSGACQIFRDLEAPRGIGDGLNAPNSNMVRV